MFAKNRRALNAKVARAAALVSAAALVLTFGVTPAVAVAPGDSHGSPSSTGAAAVERTYVDGSGVVHYKFDPSTMPGMTVRKEVGVRGEGASCKFDGGGSGAATESGPSIEVGAEITFDPKTCGRQLAVAKYRLDEAPDEVLSTLEVPEGMTTKTLAETGPESAALLANWYGSINARVQDPVGIHVTSTTSEHTWNTGGAVAHGNWVGWYAPTGWQHVSSEASNSATSTNTKGFFVNVPFCNVSAPTYSNHSRTEFRGYTSGAWDWGYAMYKWGDCDYLLSYHYSVVTP
jgi:hypothetical protein